MTPLSPSDLWLPILAAALAVHVLSTLAWTVAPHHRPEWRHLPAGGPLGAALQDQGARPGDQFLLSEGAADDKDPAKCRGMLILWRRQPSMARNIAMTLGFFLLAAFLIGYLASIALPREAAPVDVFRFTFTAGVLTHAAAGVPTIIWFRRKFLMDLVDGVAYAAATAAAFTLLWPS
ncbi:hypothetical protein [Botrimarina sp.]|uniref:hypothetical protein n=1 Tax=Botrimarina sp. TaxID=2795802 RepID=UPI0032EABCD8